jgi:hypothetical protein
MTRIQTLLLALLLAGAATPAAAEPLARLFATPAERTALDRLRLQGPAAAGKVRGEELAPPAQVTLEGYARNSRGKATAWINSDGGAAARLIGARGRGQPTLVALRHPAGKRIALRVGQTYDSASGKVREQYQPRPAPPVVDAVAGQ